MTDASQTDASPAAPPVASVEPAAAAKPADALYLVDGSGFIFRAFHAIPPLTRSDGTPVNAVMGFTNMLMKLLADHHAEAVAVIFDSKRLTFRNDFYPDYKAHRPEPPEELKPQFAIIREAVEAFCVPCIELEGFEADDLIATYARLAREQGRPVTIVSSDKDLMQLVGDGVGMLDPMKNKTIGVEEVFEKFGVTPDKVVDVQALAGDPTDNVPGVPGIGVKTAAQLIGEYGDLEALLERAGEIKQPKRRQALIDNAELARVSKRLVKLDDQVPVPTPLDDLKVREPDHEKLLGFLRQQGFRSIITRVENEIRADGRLVDGASAPQSAASTGEAIAGETPAPSPTASPRAQFDGKGSYELVQTAEALDRWIAAAYEAGTLAVDTETDSLTACSCKLVGISMAVEQGAACYIPVGHVGPDGAKAEGSLDLMPSDAPKQLPVDEVVAKLKPLLEDPSVLKIGHNLKFDIQVFGSHGIRLAPIDDTMLISYVLETGLHGHGMDELAKLHCGYTPITYDQVTGTGKSRVTFDRVALDKATEYAAEDADVTLRLHHALKPRLVPERMTTLYETIERPLIPVVADMEAEGILVDRAVLSDLSRDLGGRLAELETEVHRLAGHPFNVGSPKQLGEVLFAEMGLAGGKKGKTGAYSTDSATLEPLAEQGHDIVQKVLDWRQLAKLKSTYTDSLQQQIDPKTGRVHTSFALAITGTGRLSSTDPNLQNIPIRTEEGRKIRRAFIAKPGHVLLSVDYSQIELRLVAEMAGIEALKHGLPRGHRHPRDDGEPGVRRAARPDDRRDPAQGQGDQLRHHLRHQRLRPRPPARHFGRGGQRLHQDLPGAVLRACGLYGPHQGVLPPQRLRHDPVRPPLPHPGHRGKEPRPPPVRRASGDQRSDPGNGRRHHQARHDPHPAGPGRCRASGPHAAPGPRRTGAGGAGGGGAETADLVRRTMEAAASLGVPLVAEAGTGHSWAEAH